MPDYKYNYRRRLPHIQPPGAILFVTFNLAGALPKSVEERIRLQTKALQEQAQKHEEDPGEMVLAWKRIFKFADDHMDNSTTSLHLRHTAAAQVVVDTILNRSELKRYRLHRFCVMPNHVHMLLEPMPENINLETLEIFEPSWPPMFWSDSGRAVLTKDVSADNLVWRPLWKITKSIKGATARPIMEAAKCALPVWQSESYDHWVRDAAEYERILNYIDQNPVKARLCKEAENYRWSSAGMEEQP